MADKLSREAARCNALSPRSDAVFEMVAADIEDRPGGAAWRLRGESMRPLLRDGDLLKVEAVPATVRTGELLLFRSGHDELVCHRVLQAGPPIVLAGDHNQRLDRVSPERLLGRAVAAERGGRRLRLDRGLPALGRLPLGLLHRRSQRWLTGSSPVRRRLGWALEVARVGLAHLVAISWTWSANSQPLDGRRPAGD